MKVKWFLIFVIILGFADSALTAPAAPDSRFYDNDGVQVELIKWGDEFLHGFETTDGYTVLYDINKDLWLYADRDENGLLYPTNLMAGKDNPLSLNLPQHLRYGKDYIKKLTDDDPEYKLKKDYKQSLNYVKTTGTMQTIALFINFPDQAETFKSSEFNSHLFSSNPASPRSLTDYYDEISYGNFHLTGETVGWFTADYNKAYYGGNNAYGNDKNHLALIRETFEKADSYVDYSKYDSDNDGFVDAVIVVHSGRGEESSGGEADDLWSRNGTIDPPYNSADGVKVARFTIQPEMLWSVKMPVGVFCHEFGHILGLPDLYDVDYSSNGIGLFGLMGFGSWNTTTDWAGETPAHMCAWSKYKLGWFNPTPITSNGQKTLAAVANAASCYMLNSNMPAQEYFLVENRQKISFDAGLPGNGGILIWHVDDAKIDDNTDENHKLCDLEQAQATQDLDFDPDDANASDGCDADYFRQGKTFTDTSNPNSRNYSGASTNISITDITQVKPDKSMSFNASIGSTTPPTGLKWKFKTGGIVQSSPAVGYDGTIYVGSSDGYLYAVNPDGTLKWKFMAKGEIWSSPTVGSDGTVYIGSDDFHVYAVNSNGTQKWKYITGSYVESTPALSADGTIYFGSYDNNFYALNKNGTLKWGLDAELPIKSSPSVNMLGIIYIGAPDAALYSISPLGDINWWFDTNDAIFSKPALGNDGTIYIGSNDKALYAVNIDGSYKWHFITGDCIQSSPAVGDDGTIYFGSFDGYLYALNDDGTLKWKFRTTNAVYSSPAVATDGTVYVGSDDFKVYAVNPNGSMKWSYETGGVVGSSPVIGSDGTVYVGSNDTYLYALGSSNQTSKLKFNLHLLPVSSSFRNGDNINMLLDLECPANSTKCDIYFVMQKPGSNGLLFGFNWNQIPATIITNFTLPANTMLKDAKILTLALPSMNPPVNSPGTYTFAIAATQPGTMDFVSNIATISFTKQ